MRLVIILVFLAITFYTPAFSFGQLIGTDPTLEEVFSYADLVVEGVIEKITRVTVPYDDFYPGGSGPEMRMAIMDFRIDTVLVGYQPKDHIDIVAGLWTSPSVYYFDFEEGEKYILSLYFPTTGRLFESGRYIVGTDSAKFLLNGTRWVQGSKGNRLAEGELPALYDVLEKVRRDRSIEYLTKEAELIIRGVVLDSWAVDERTGGCIDKHIIQTRFDIHDILKGIVEESSITISTIIKGLYSPSWRMRVPDLEIGEEWILFLKSAEEPGYYPFEGVNGMFMVEGNALVRNNNNRVTTGITVDHLMAEVNRIVKE